MKKKQPRRRFKPITFGRKKHKCEVCNRKLNGPFKLCYWCRKRRLS